MEIKELTYSYGRTLQVEAFNPINIHASIKAEVNNKDNMEVAYSELKKIVIDKVNRDIESAIIALRNPQPAPRKPYTPNKFAGISDNVDQFGNELKYNPIK